MRRLVIAWVAFAAACASAPVRDLAAADAFFELASSPAGLWSVQCVARRDTNHDGRVEILVGEHGTLRGDRGQLHLTVGRRPSEPIDRLLAVDPRGRYLLFVQSGATVLFDAERGTRTPLNAFIPPHRYQVADFDSRGERLVYARRYRDLVVPIVRDLSTGAERSVDIPEGDPVALYFESSGWLYLRLTRHRPEVGEGTAAPYVCDTVWWHHHDRMLTDNTGRYFVPVNGGPAVPVPAQPRLVGFGANLLEESGDGALFVRTPQGKRRELVPASCGARVRYLDGERSQLVVACHRDSREVRSSGRGSSGTVVPVWLYGGGEPVPLGIDVPEEIASEGLYRAWGQTTSRLVVVGRAAEERWSYAVATIPLGADSALLDLDRRTVVNLGPVHVVGMWKSRVAYEDAAGVGWLEDVDTKEKVRVAGEKNEFSELESANGSFVLVKGVVADLAAMKVVGRMPSGSRRLTSKGEAVLWDEGVSGARKGPMRVRPLDPLSPSTTPR